MEFVYGYISVQIIVHLRKRTLYVCTIIIKVQMSKSVRLRKRTNTKMYVFINAHFLSEILRSNLYVYECKSVRLWAQKVYAYE